MPFGDGTGPRGQGPGTGKGQGRGMGMGSGETGGNRPGRGPGGSCICPSCGTRKPHIPGAPCTEISCPKCGNKMVRG